MAGDAVSIATLKPAAKQSEVAEDREAGRIPAIGFRSPVQPPGNLPMTRRRAAHHQRNQRHGRIQFITST